MSLEEDIKAYLQKHYPKTNPDHFFNYEWRARPFKDDLNTTCCIGINDDQSILIVLSTETQPKEKAHEIKNGVTITYCSWNDYLCRIDEEPVIYYDTEKTVTDINQIVPTIEALYKKINALRLDC